MTRIAMTGASGRYGRLATDKLIAQGRARDLILITRTPAKLADRAQAGCEVRYGDFDNPETLQAALSGAGKLLLISGTRVGARVRQHKAAIEAAAAAGVGHIVYTSFVNVEPANPAIVTIDHRETEKLIKASGAAHPSARCALCRRHDPECRPRLHRIRGMADEHEGWARGHGVARGLRRLRRRRADEPARA